MERDKIKSRLKDYTLSDYEGLFDKYKDWLVPEKVEPDVEFPHMPGEIGVFQFRCNEPISFNNEQRNNDLLVIIKINEDGSVKDEFFDVTCDPKDTKPGIAHSCAQIYRGNVGSHRGDPSRPCIRSDYGFGTWFNRTDANGEVKDLNPSPELTSIADHIGINIHNANGCYNSSLGCTILSSEGAYRKTFVPLITSCRNKLNIFVALIDVEDFEDILGIEKEEAETATPTTEETK
jgi:hypothetical protein